MGDHSGDSLPIVGTIRRRRRTGPLDTTVARLRAENERLRAALEAARPALDARMSMEAWCGWWETVARPALSPLRQFSGGGVVSVIGAGWEAPMGDHSDSVLAEVAVERLNQDRKWGQQDHQDRVTMYGTAVHRAAYGIESASWHRGKLEAANERHECSWARILLEEVAEAMDECAKGDTVALRAELVQVAAVAAAWVECIDRRWAGGTNG